MKIHQLSIADAFRNVQSSEEGLTNADAAERLLCEGKKSRRTGSETAWQSLRNQFRSPLVLLLLVAMAISLFLGDRVSTQSPGETEN